MSRQRILVCGSRDWSDSFAIHACICAYPAALFITGGARGADQIAAEECEFIGEHCAVIKPLWKKFGQRAGYLRNLVMLDLEPDLVVAFTTGSRGTQHTINEARKRGIPVEVHGTECPV